MIDPRLAVLCDWLTVQMAPAPDIDDILRRLDDQEREGAGFSPAAGPFPSAPLTQA